MPWLTTTLEYAGNVAKGVGALTAFGGVYVTLGGPLPATRHYVKQEIENVSDGLTSLSRTVMDGQRKTIRADRNALRARQDQLERQLLTVTNASDRILIKQRLGEVQDQLEELKAEDAAIRDRIGKALPPPLVPMTTR